MPWFHFLLLLWVVLLSNVSLALSALPSPRSPRRNYRETVLVTGGAGYIGSHTCLELLQENYRVIVVDNLDNSCEEALERVKTLIAQKPGNDDSDDGECLIFRHVDIRDAARLEEVLQEFPDISSCIHFAGKKAVGESVAQPLEYYDCNVAGTVTLLRLLQKHAVYKLVFSSSATVYGDPEQLPVTESARLQATNPYGRTKLFIEEILRDLQASQPNEWKIWILRYFNPIGAHPSGRMGEDPQGIPNNLMPFIAQVCVGRRAKLSVFGNDYDTPDGSGVRDYIHVVDLARGHVAALDQLYSSGSGSSNRNHDPTEEGKDDTAVAAAAAAATGGYCQAVNLGTGRGVSVLELVRGMSEATGKPVPYEITARRPGDVAAVYADASLAAKLLNWRAQLGVKEMCEDTWNWQKNNPYGYTASTSTSTTDKIAPAVEQAN